MRTNRITILSLVLLALSWNPSASHSQNSGELDSPTIILGTVAGDRGTTVSLPVYFKGGGGTVSKLSFAVKFISNSVKFDKVDASGITPSQDLTVDIQPEDLPPEANGLPQTMLKINVSISGGDSKPLPDGLWVFLAFRLTQEAKSFAVNMQPYNIEAIGLTGKPVKVLAEAGKVIVSSDDEPLVGCFFFTH